MSETIRNIAYNSMASLLQDREYDDNKKSKYVELISEDVLEQLKKASSAYSYYVTTVLMNRNAHAWVHQRSYFHIDDDFHIRSEFNNEEWNAYTYVFSFLKENRIACADRFQNHIGEVQNSVFRGMEKYLLGKDFYDPSSSKHSIICIADSILDDLIPVLSNFSFGINVYLAAKNCGSCSHSCGFCFAEDGSTCQVFQNDGYFGCAHVVAFVN